MEVDDVKVWWRLRKTRANAASAPGMSDPGAVNEYDNVVTRVSTDGRSMESTEASDDRSFRSHATDSLQRPLPQEIAILLEEADDAVERISTDGRTPEMKEAGDAHSLLSLSKRSVLSRARTNPGRRVGSRRVRDKMTNA